MRHAAILAAAAFALGTVLAGVGTASANDRATAEQGKAATSSRAKSKRATRVKGYLWRGGYYSYNDSDVVNTYGGSRSLFGSVNTYRDPVLDRQTISGPFDHDFFFDSGIARGNSAPYPR